MPAHHASSHRRCFCFARPPPPRPPISSLTSPPPSRDTHTHPINEAREINPYHPTASGFHCLTIMCFSFRALSVRGQPWWYIYNACTCMRLVNLLHNHVARWWSNCNIILFPFPHHLTYIMVARWWSNCNIILFPFPHHLTSFPPSSRS